MIAGELLRACPLLVLGVACHSDVPEPATLELTMRDSASVNVIELSHALNDVAAGGVIALTLEPDLLLGPVEGEFSFVADVAVLDDGRFAILDRMKKRVTLHGADGTVLARLGREGGGPGEYHEPWVIATMGEHLVIWDADVEKAFTVLRPDGAVVSTSRALIKGDWVRIPFRSPHLYLDWPYQMPPEDITRRLRGLDAETFVHQIQTDEALVAWPEGLAALQANLVVYNLALDVVDTLATLPGPVPPPWGPSTARGAYSGVRQPLFAARPVWTTGDGWFAVGHGLEPRLDVIPVGQHISASVVRWPEIERPITEDDRLALATWYMEEHLLKDMSLRGGNRWVHMSRRERRREIERWANHQFPFAQRAPEITASYGAGPCLWIAGHRAADYPDGTALTWVVVNLVEASVRAVRIPRRGARVRDVSVHGVFTSFKDEDGVHHIERYPITDLGCQPTRATGAQH